MADGTLYGGGPLQVVVEFRGPDNPPSVGEEFARARKRWRDERAAVLELEKSLARTRARQAAK